VNDLTVLRVDRKRIPLERRAAFSSDAGALAESVYAAARQHAEHVVVLSTCERFEIYFTPTSGVVDVLLHASPLMADACAERADDAVRHLFRVAAGLESRIPGEPHVLGQVRDALEDARRRDTAHGQVVDVFRRAVQCGRRVRTSVPFAAGAAGYTARTIDRLRAELGTLEGRQILVVGTGTLAADLARSLRYVGVAGLAIAGRHDERVARLARQFDARPFTVAALHALPTRFDAVVTAVSAGDPIIASATLRTCQTNLLVDLGASPNVDASVRRLPGVRVLGLDDLGGVPEVAEILARATDVVERHLARHRASLRRTTFSVAPLAVAS
jgi:glutamyl-tRNA reductase